MKHFIVINDWVNRSECDINILAVAHTLEEAKEIFNTYVDNEREYARENNWEIFEDTDTVFESGKNWHYASNHSKMFIVEV